MCKSRIAMVSMGNAVHSCTITYLLLIVLFISIICLTVCYYFVSLPMIYLLGNDGW